MFSQKFNWRWPPQSLRVPYDTRTQTSHPDLTTVLSSVLMKGRFLSKQKMRIFLSHAYCPFTDLHLIGDKCVLIREDFLFEGSDGRYHGVSFPGYVCTTDRWKIHVTLVWIYIYFFTVKQIPAHKWTVLYMLHHMYVSSLLLMTILYLWPFICGLTSDSH